MAQGIHVDRLGGTEPQTQSQDKTGVGVQGVWGGPNNDWPGVPLPGEDPQSPSHPDGRDPWSLDPPTTFPRPSPPIIDERPQQTPPRMPPRGEDLPENGGYLGRPPLPIDWDQFTHHTINQDGIAANQAYAEMLVRDSDPSQTARMLKRAIDDYGDQGLWTFI